MKQKVVALFQGRLAWIAVAAIALILIAVEAAYFAPADSPLRRYAGFSWLTISVALLISTWVYSLRPFFEPAFWRDPHRYWYLLAFLAPIAYAYVDLTGYYFAYIDPEGISGLRDAHDQMLNDNAYGIYSIGNWRYPARHYLINNQPTYWFGPSLLALRIGMTIGTLGGLTFFLAALRTHLIAKDRPLPTLSAAFATSVIGLGYFAMTYIRKFDTCNQPLGVMLLFLAALLLYELRQTPWRYLCLFWVFGYFPYSYSPAIAGWALALVLHACLIVQRRRYPLIPVILYGILAFTVAALVTRNVIPDKFRFGPPEMNLNDWIWRWFQALTSLGSAKESLIPAPLNLAVFVALYLSITRRRPALPLILCWGLVTTFIAFTISGFNFDEPYFHTEKALLILPVYALASILILARYLSENRHLAGLLKTAQVFFCASIIYMLITGIQVPFIDPGFLPPRGDCLNFEELLADINNVNWNPHLPKPKKIYLIPPLDIIDNGPFQYFNPGITVINGTPPPGEKIPGTYIFSFIDPQADRTWDPIVTSRHPRPWFKMEIQ